MPKPDRIAAIATAPGRGGIGVVRVSGEDLTSMAQAILGKCPLPRHAAYLDFLDDRAQVIDRGIALYFPAPHSYTGEDVLELQAHGGPVLLQLLLQRCLNLGARLAQPGEFSKRAYLNDKLDLAQAEAVADVIEATTAEAARSAVRSLTGEFSSRIRALRDKLVNLRMLVEACLDFPEEDADFISEGGVAEKLAGVADELENVFCGARQGNILREGIHVALIGRPNVGKSSLLNQLSGEELAIVTPAAGTTRDAIKSAINIEGVPLHMIDTAGLRETDDEIERAGIARTWQAIATANVALLLLDAALGLEEADRAILERLPQTLPVIRVFNKIDLCEETPRQERENDITSIFLSAKTGAGVALLRAHLLELIGWHAGSEGVYMARERHLQALSQVRECIQRAKTNLGQPELLAEELRLAQEALNQITGEFTSDDLLGEIFSRFCIGK